MATYEDIKGSLFQLNQQLAGKQVPLGDREGIMNQFLIDEYGIDFTSYDMMMNQEKKYSENRTFDALVGSVRAGFQGLSLGLGDELEAYLRSHYAKLSNTLGDRNKAYEQIKNEIQASIAGYEKANPNTSFALEMVGGFAIPYLGTSVNIARRGVRMATPFLKSGTGRELITQGLAGVGLGGLYEYGKTDKITPEGLALSGGLGVGGQVIGQSLGKGISKLTDKPYVGPTARLIKDKITGGDPPEGAVGKPPTPSEQIDPNLPAKTIDAESVANDQEAMRLILKRFEEQNLPFDQLTDELARFQLVNRGKIASIYDLSTAPHPQTGTPLGLTQPVPDLAVGNIINSPKASGVAQRNMQQRAIGVKDRALEDVNKLFGTIPPKFGDIYTFKDVRKETMRNNAKPFYSIADPVAINDQGFSDLMRNALQRSDVAKKAYKDSYRDVVQKGFTATKEPLGMTVRQFDRFKKALDSEIGQLIKAGDHFNSSSLLDIKNNLINYVDDYTKKVSPIPPNSRTFGNKYAGESPYKVARSFYASDESSEMAFDLGTEAVSNLKNVAFKEDHFINKYQKLSTPEKRMALLGLGAGLRDLVKRQTFEEGDIRKVLQGGGGENTLQNILRYAINNIDLTLEGAKRQAGARKRLARFEEAMKVERQLLGNFRKIFRGSDTTPKAESVDRAKEATKGFAGELLEAGASVAGANMLIPPIYTPAGLLYRGQKIAGFKQQEAQREKMEKLSDAISARLTDPNVPKQVQDLKNFQRYLQMRSPQRFRTGIQNPLMYSLLDER